MTESKNKKKGIECPGCGCRDFRELNGQPSEPITIIEKTEKGIRLSDNPWKIIKTENFKGFVRRKRRCRYCGRIVVTRERPEE